MPRYEIEFYREVTVSEWVKRVIEAPDQEAALDHAREMASDFNMDCPDDVAGDQIVDCKDWEVDHDNVVETTKPADEVVEGDEEEDDGSNPE